MSNTPSSDIFATMTYRVQALEQQLQQTQNALAQVRDQAQQLTALQQNLQQIRDQLGVYVRASENDIKLQSIVATLSRIENDLRDALVRFEREIQESKRLASDLAAKVLTGEAETRAGQDKIKLWVLGGIVGFVFLVLAGIVVAYATHLIH